MQRDVNVSDYSSSEDSSDDYSPSDEQDNNSSDTSKKLSKRSIEWCGVDTETYDYPKLPTRKVVWPPPSSSTPSASGHPHFTNVRIGNPKLGGKMQLFCRTGYYLAIYPDGKVRGTEDENDMHTYLEVVSAGYSSHVKIRGLLTNLFIATNKRGALYGEVDPMEESTVYIESFQGSYNAYLSRKYAHLGWYIALKRNGKQKRGHKTRYGQRAVKFLPKRSKFE
ncbi:unnamed protein product [Phaedon cochleariae]|uniref:Fibroblast growth factor n=1 Tax=Phaedon cochleariae TaxID=80249 RepID=A0A9N9SAK5_PHACE|nr:unnamed protein product [Phaedon cochleariae]